MVTWNPWHGCKKHSEGCQNCYVYFFDKKHGKDASEVYRVKNNFDAPVKRDRNGNFKIKEGELVGVCLTSDFFLEEADSWREEAWNIMSQRPDLEFMIITKRPERIMQCLPKSCGDGLDNIHLVVTIENQKRADERIPILLELPFKKKGITCSPMLGAIDIEKYLTTKGIDSVSCDGERYDGARPCSYEWVKSLSDQCKRTNTNFEFRGTGTYFVKDGVLREIGSKEEQYAAAEKLGLNYDRTELLNSIDTPHA